MCAKFPRGGAGSFLAGSLTIWRSKVQVQFIFARFIFSLIIAITLALVIVTTSPHRFRAIYSVQLGIKVVGVLVVCMALLFAHLLYGIDYSYFDQSPLCVSINSAYGYFMFYILARVAFFLIFLLPVVIITTGNIAIVVKLRNSRRRMVPSTSTTQAGTRTSRHLVVITLLIRSAFVVFSMPALVVWSINPYVFDESNDAQRQIVFIVARALASLNLSTIFFLYILSGCRFRDLFKSVVLCNNRINAVTLNKRKIQLAPSNKIQAAPSNCKMILPVPSSNHKIQSAPSNNHKVQAAPSDCKIILPVPSSNHKIQTARSNCKMIQPAPSNSHKIQPAPSNNQMIQPAPSNNHMIQPAPSNSQMIQPAPSNNHKVTICALKQPDTTSAVKQPDTTSAVKQPDDTTSTIIKPDDTTIAAK